MSTLDQFVIINLPAYAVEKAFYQATRKKQTVPNDGSPNNPIASIGKKKTNWMQQIDQMLSEIAFSIFLFGEKIGIERFMKERELRNADPHKHDNGHDIVKGIDVKSRRKTDEEFKKWPIESDELNYDLVLRRWHRLKTFHKYVQIINEYPDSLVTGFTGQTAKETLTGWAYLYEFPHYPQGMHKGDKDEAWMLPARKLHPMSTLTCNEPTIYKPASMLKSLPVPY